MPRFIITTTAIAAISERWSIEADSPEHAKELFEEHDERAPTLKFLSDRIDGDEEDRQVVEIEAVPELSADCAAGLHSWIAEVGRLSPDTLCTHCGEPYGDPE